MTDPPRVTKKISLSYVLNNGKQLKAPINHAKVFIVILIINMNPKHSMYGLFTLYLHLGSWGGKCRLGLWASNIYIYTTFSILDKCNLCDTKWHFTMVSQEFLCINRKPGAKRKAMQNHWRAMKRSYSYVNLIQSGQIRIWLVLSTHLKNISQNGFIFPKVWDEHK